MNIEVLSPLNSKGLISQFVWGWQKCISCKKIKPYSHYQGFLRCFDCRPLAMVCTSRSCGTYECWAFTERVDKRLTFIFHVSGICMSKWSESVQDCLHELFKKCKVPAQVSIIEMSVRDSIKEMIYNGRNGFMLNDVRFKFEWI